MNCYWSHGVDEARERGEITGVLGVPPGRVAESLADSLSRKRCALHPVKSVAARAAPWIPNWTEDGPTFEKMPSLSTGNASRSASGHNYLMAGGGQRA